jgi:hypothetical protein
MDSKRHISKAAGLRLAGAPEYARESGWIAEHMAQFAAGLVIFGGRSPEPVR